MAGTMLRTTAFNDHSMIPRDHAHESGDVSPPPEWADVPDGTAEPALPREDPDAPGGTFTHWPATGIPPGTGHLEPGAEPAGCHVGRNDFGAQGYGGPYPPPDDLHRYLFRRYALAEPTGLPDGRTAEDFRRALREKRVPASGNLVGTYGR